MQHWHYFSVSREMRNHKDILGTRCAIPKATTMRERTLRYIRYWSSLTYAQHCYKSVDVLLYISYFIGFKESTPLQRRQTKFACKIQSRFDIPSYWANQLGTTILLWFRALYETISVISEKYYWILKISSMFHKTENQNGFSQLLKRSVIKSLIWLLVEILDAKFGKQNCFMQFLKQSVIKSLIRFLADILHAFLNYCNGETPWIVFLTNTN